MSNPAGKFVNSPMGTVVGVGIAVVVLLLTIGLNIVMTKIRRRGNKPRSGQLKSISHLADAKFEIIAVHGLGADPDYTWSCRDPKEPKSATYSRTHLLKDLLSKDFPEARIWSYQYDSTWLTDAPVKTTEEIGTSLLSELKATRSAIRLPLIFIGHSLGGIIIKQALCGDDSKEIVDETCGVIFLGTPHQGSHLSITGTILAFFTRFLGSDSTLIFSLQHHDKGLTNLAERFKNHGVNRQSGQTLPVISFYETKPTYLFGYFSLGQVVEKDSAILHASPHESYPIDTDHSGLNKFIGEDDEFYLKLKASIQHLRVPSILERADESIRKFYTECKRLNIERLSGDLLPLDQCYINLAIVEQTSKDMRQETQPAKGTLQNSLFARQKVETPDKAVQVKISEIFAPRKANGESEVHPKRILIRGRAGIGKTTLCKKMVNDFISETQTAINLAWAQFFDRVLWIPLRNLKKSDAPQNLHDLILKEFFEDRLERKEGIQLVQELEKEVMGSGRERTLFILDGLDEVIYDLGEHGDSHPLLSRLLNMPSVILMSRPNARLPSLVDDLDLELETVGFYPDQVQAYLENHPGIGEHLSDVQSFLQRNWLLQGLVRIPIQLDAYCYIWEGASTHSLNTMTCIYQAIERNLWRKDVVKLRPGFTSTRAQGVSQSEIYDIILAEVHFLEYLAFNGLYGNIIDFTPEFRDKLANHERSKGRKPPSDIDLAKLSFIRTSDQSPRLEDRSYHFIHLSFQEYFAARYFVRRWNGNQELEIVASKQHRQELSPRPVEFLSQFKYLPKYDIFWRFVAGVISEDDEEIAAFFEQVDAQPRDLLGPVHQRFIMHCLSEVQVNGEQLWRARLENNLTEVLLAEYGISETSHIAGAMEFPERSLIQALHQGSEEQQISILSYMERNSFLRERTMYLVIHWLKFPISKQKAIAILHLLRGYQRFRHIEDLGADILTAIVGRLGDEDSDVRQAAMKALQGQQDLSADTLTAIVGRLADEDWHVREAALEVLQGPQDLSADTLAAIVGRLADKDWHVREAAMKVLQSQQDLSPDTLTTVVGRLGDKDPVIREAAMKVLQSRQDLSADTITMIVGRLADEDWHVREATIKALQGQQDLSPDTLTTVVGRLGDKDLVIREAAMKVLQSRQDLSADALTVIVGRLTDKDWHVREAAMKVLQSRQDLSADALTVIVGRLADEDWHIREAAIKMLQSQQDLSTDALNMIVGRLADEDWHVRKATIKTLQGQWDLSPDTLTTVVGRLGDKDPVIREAAMKVLQSRQDLSADALNMIVGRLADEDWHVREVAMKVLQSRQDLSADALTVIVGRLADEDWHVREAALEVLQGRQDLSADALNMIVGRLADEDWHVRKATIKALQGQRDLSPDTLTAIVGRLGDEDSDIRQAAMKALQGQQDLSADTLTAIVGWLADEDWSVRKATIKVLQGQQVLSADIITTITSLLGDEEWDISEAAMKVLQSRQDLSADALTVIVGRLTDKDWHVREVAMKVLQSRQDLSADALTVIVGRLADEDWHVREAALEVLQGQQDLSADALNMIVGRLADEDWHVREAAMKVLQSRQDLSADALTVIVGRLADEDWHVREAALEVLQGQGQEDLSVDTLTVIAGRLADEYWTVREAALKVLQGRQVLSADIITTITSLLGDEEWDISEAALKALQGQQDLSPDTLITIIGQLGDDDFDTSQAAINQAAIEVLQGQQDLSADTLTAIVKWLGDKDSYIREAALDVLQGQYNLTPDALSAIGGWLNDEDWCVHKIALRALQDQPDLNPDTLTAIVRRLGDEDPDTRHAALVVLKVQHNLSLDTLNAITGRLGDEDWLIRAAAVEVLQDQLELSADALTVIVGRLADEDWHVRKATIKALQGQRDLSPDTLTAIVGRLGDGDWYVRQAALEFLQGQHDLPLNAIIRSGEVLYHNMLKTSFSENIHWCVSNQSLRITFDFQILQFRDDSVELEDMLSEIHRWCSQFGLHRHILPDHS